MPDHQASRARLSAGKPPSPHCSPWARSQPLAGSPSPTTVDSRFTPRLGACGVLSPCRQVTRSLAPAGTRAASGLPWPRRGFSGHVAASLRSTPTAPLLPGASEKHTGQAPVGEDGTRCSCRGKWRGGSSENSERTCRASWQPHLSAYRPESRDSGGICAHPCSQQPYLQQPTGGSDPNVRQRRSRQTSCVCPYNGAFGLKGAGVGRLHGVGFQMAGFTVG